MRLRQCRSAGSCLCLCPLIHAELTRRWVGAEGATGQHAIAEIDLAYTADHLAFTFPFLTDEKSKVIRPPRKILLSADRRLLLLFGAMHQGESALLVYQIGDGYPELSFRLLFSDLTLSFLDACFAPTSDGLAVIPRRYPCCLFFLSLRHLLVPPTTDSSASAAAATTTGTAAVSPVLPQPPFGERHFGPLGMIGPITKADGELALFTRIAANVCSSVANPTRFDYVTWGNDASGDYYLWRVDTQGGPSGSTLPFEFAFRSLCNRADKDDVRPSLVLGRCGRADCVGWL